MSGDGTNYEGRLSSHLTVTANQLKRMRVCFAALAFAVLSGCGGGSSSDPGSGGPAVDPKPVPVASGYPADPASCDAAGQRAWLRDYMNDQYFWFDQQRAPDAAASTLPQYFASLLFAPVDRYSFAQSTTECIQFLGTASSPVMATRWPGLMPRKPC